MYFLCWQSWMNAWSAATRIVSEPTKTPLYLGQQRWRDWKQWGPSKRNLSKIPIKWREPKQQTSAVYSLQLVLPMPPTNWVNFAARSTEETSRLWHIGHLTFYNNFKGLETFSETRSYNSRHLGGLFWITGALAWQRMSLSIRGRKIWSVH